MRVVVGSDSYGCDLADAVAAWLREQGLRNASHDIERREARVFS